MGGVLIWNKAAARKRAQHLAKAQDYVDQQMLEKMTPYVPVGLPKYKNAGRLRDSGRIKAPGRIVYTAPFAKRDYYANVNHKHGGNPNAKRLWFRVTKAKYSKKILSDAQKIIGGRAWT